MLFHISPNKLILIVRIAWDISLALLSVLIVTSFTASSALRIVSNWNFQMKVNVGSIQIRLLDPIQ